MVSPTVHANKGAQGTTDGYLALPVSKYATRFFLPSFDRTTDGHSTFAIAAIYNDTCVEAWALVYYSPINCTTCMCHSEIQIVKCYRIPYTYSYMGDCIEWLIRTNMNTNHCWNPNFDIKCKCYTLE